MRFESRTQLADDVLRGLRGVSRVAHEDGETVLLTRDVPRTIGGLLELGDGLGLEGLDVAVRRPTLEDVFLELTGRALRD